MIRHPILLALRLYKILLSPFLGQNCRFMPSCSEYAAQAVKRYGVLRGGLIAFKRICRCHPWGGSGLDDVP